MGRGGSSYLSKFRGRPAQDVAPLPEQDKAALRAQLVPAMIALSHPADKSIRAQIAESVALIAELDFPSKWPDLIDVRPVRPHRTHLTPSPATRPLPLPN